MQVLHDITIDVLRPRRTVIKVVQEDSVRKIRLTLLKGNQNYDVSSGLDGETLLKFVEFRKSDGHGGMYDTTSTGETAVELEDQSVGNVWLVALDGQCFTCPGWAQINVRFETEDGKRIHTFPIMVDVSPTASSDTESTDWGELNSIGDMKAAITAMFEETMSVEAKQALLNLLAHVAYTDEHGQDYYDALEAELFQTADIVSISAVFDQGSAVIYDTDDLDTLRQYLTVTATYEDLSTREITAYTLSGTLEEGTSTITVSCGEKTATFTVDVSNTYQEVEWIEATGTQMIATDIVPGSATFSFEVGFYKASQATTSQALVAGYIIGTYSGLQRFSASFRNTTNKFGIYSSSWQEITASNLYGNNAVLSVTFNTSSPYATGSLVAGGQTTQISKTTANFQDIGEGTINFFNVSESGQAWASARLMYCKFHKNNELFADFVPCYRKTDGEIGLLETISGKFFTNAGTGTFLKGGDVV